jgi:hypothetical protein
LVIGVVVFAMTRNNHESAAATVAKTDPPKHVITVESLPPEQPPTRQEPIVTSIGSADAKTDVKPDVAPVKTEGTPDPKTVAKGDPKTDAKTETPGRTNRQTHVQQVHKQTHKQTEIAAPKPGLTRDAVAAKLSALRREYDIYKSKNGGRLDGDWGDLAMYMQYHLTDSTLDEAAHRIDAFRAKMRE